MKRNAFFRWIEKHRLNTPILPIVLLAAIGIYGYAHNFEFPIVNRLLDLFRMDETPSQSGDAALQVSFACDGRTTCPQMTSCAEAKFFLKNCPTENMDGDLDGVPCESEWCSR